jgi:hypothetical protein
MVDSCLLLMLNWSGRYNIYDAKCLVVGRSNLKNLFLLSYQCKYPANHSNVLHKKLVLKPKNLFQEVGWCLSDNPVPLESIPKHTHWHIRND